MTTDLSKFDTTGAIQLGSLTYVSSTKEPSELPLVCKHGFGMWFPSYIHLSHVGKGKHSSRKVAELILRIKNAADQEKGASVILKLRGTVFELTTLRNLQQDLLNAYRQEFPNDQDHHSEH